MGHISLINTELNETYHSIHGAIQESKHFFIDAGLHYLLNQRPEKVSVLEMGFGTGLNAFLTLIASDEIAIEYTSVESKPIPEEIYIILNYPRQLKTGKEKFLLLHQADWGKQVRITDHFSLTKYRSRIEDIELSPAAFNLVYYDAFAPGKQFEVWEKEVLKKVTDAIQPGGILVTYCAKGQFKRDLKALGLTVETLPGPPGKYEMVRAIK